jgi:DNA-directed RNA polymerase subunit RPC12/RpoP
LETKRFKMIDEGFVCTVCGADVPSLGRTARDHCPECLCSLHVDINPGDRAADCGGILSPVGIKNGKKGIQIVYKCQKCGMGKVNIIADDDNYEFILRLSQNG